MRIFNGVVAALALAWVPSVAAANEGQECAPSASISSDGSSASVGGSGSAGCTYDSDGNCVCPQQQGDAESGTGGAGMGSGSMMAPRQEQNVTVIDSPSADRDEKAPNEGLMVALNGGVEGYTSSLAPRLRAGPSWGLTIGAAPTSLVGIELQYIGANNRVVDPTSPLAEDNNTRVIRNGGNVDVKVALSPTPLEPFVFGGVGISRASIRNDVEGSGYQDDTFGQIPVGAGVNYHIGDFTAGARFTFNYLFDRDFTPPTPGGAFGIADKQGGDIYDGQITLGGTF